MEQQTRVFRNEVYERFKTTVQHALGNEIGWNHLAVLFYTTKGVVSAFGHGSKLASFATEMTIQYCNERLATWILDQGGYVRTHLINISMALNIVYFIFYVSFVCYLFILSLIISFRV